MFPGFPKEAVTFFKGLARNNNREWFQPRKEIFESKVKTPMVGLVEALNAEFAKYAPDYINDPKKAVYRIYRDVRFSSDKSHVAIDAVDRLLRIVNIIRRRRSTASIATCDSALTSRLTKHIWPRRLPGAE